MRGARRVCKRGPQVGPKGPFGPAGVFCLFAIAGFEKCLYLCINFSGTQPCESKLSIALVCKSFALSKLLLPAKCSDLLSRARFSECMNQMSNKKTKQVCQKEMVLRCLYAARKLSTI